MRPATRDLIGHGIAWGIIAACAVCLGLGLFGCAATQKPAQTTTATAGRDSTQQTEQTSEQTAGGQAQRARVVNGTQTANQFDLSRNQLLLGLAVLAGLALVIVGGMAWCLFLGWFAPQPADVTVSLLARIYLIAFPAAVVIGCGAAVWLIVQMLK